MRKLIIAGLVVVVLVAADVLARSWAESKLAEQAAAYYPAASASSAEIRSFPFLGRLLVAGDVSAVSLRMDNLRVGPVPVGHLRFDLDDVKIDRRAMFSGRVRVLDIGTGRVEALVESPLAGTAAAVGAEVRNLLPCDAEIRSVPEGALVACTVEDVPPALVQTRN